MFTFLLTTYLISLTFIFAFYLGECDGNFDGTSWSHIGVVALVPIFNTLLTIVILVVVSIDIWRDYFENDEEVSDPL